MNCVIGSINDLVGQSAYSRHRPAFGTNSLQHSLSAFGRMRPACLAEALLQNFISRLQKNYMNMQTGFAQGGELSGEVGEKTTLANVYYERRPVSARPLSGAGMSAAQTSQAS